MLDQSFPVDLVHPEDDAQTATFYTYEQWRLALQMGWRKQQASLPAPPPTPPPERKKAARRRRKEMPSEQDMFGEVSRE